LNNILLNNRKKAGISVCLFLCTFFCTAQEWKFDSKCHDAYELALNLNPAASILMLDKPKTIQEEYILSFAEAIELLATENPGNFKNYETHFEERLSKNWTGNIRDEMFLGAEMHLQWTLINLKAGNELEAALHLKRAYQIATECRRKFPDFTPIYKTTGLLEIIIGSVPEKYNWIFSLMNMKGNVQNGLMNLERVKNSTSSFSFEADLLLVLVKGFILQRTAEALDQINAIKLSLPDHRLVNFLAAAIAMKDSKGKEALAFLENIFGHVEGIQLPYVEYLYGEALLQKGDYVKAIDAYDGFINRYPGQNFLKDAYYKIGICHQLLGDSQEAKSSFEVARTKGREVTEADKYAAQSLQRTNLPNVMLSKVRYFTDGGYYQEAETVLNKISLTDIPSKQEQVEYYYRRGRLAHKREELAPAKLFYIQTIEMSGDSPWYFAPNACLQMGNILTKENHQVEAKKYFHRALQYKKHEYKNSIDSKAKSALDQLKRK
jgi:tetratricopeptide (TPR) repeat protein